MFSFMFSIWIEIVVIRPILKKLGFQAPCDLTLE